MTSHLHFLPYKLAAWDIQRFGLTGRPSVGRPLLYDISVWYRTWSLRTISCMAPLFRMSRAIRLSILASSLSNTWLRLMSAERPFFNSDISVTQSISCSSLWDLRRWEDFLRYSWLRHRQWSEMDDGGCIRLNDSWLTWSCFVRRWVSSLLSLPSLVPPERANRVKSNGSNQHHRPYYQTSAVSVRAQNHIVACSFGLNVAWRPSQPLAPPPLSQAIFSIRIIVIGCSSKEIVTLTFGDSRTSLSASNALEKSSSPSDLPTCIVSASLHTNFINIDPLTRFIQCVIDHISPASLCSTGIIKFKAEGDKQHPSSITIGVQEHI